MKGAAKQQRAKAKSVVGIAASHIASNPPPPTAGVPGGSRPAGVAPGGGQYKARKQQQGGQGASSAGNSPEVGIGRHDGGSSAHELSPETTNSGGGDHSGSGGHEGKHGGHHRRGGPPGQKAASGHPQHSPGFRHASPVGSGQRSSTPPPSEPQHPLESTWCLWILNTRSNQGDWKEKMKEAHDFSTVEEFWCMHNHIRGPSDQNSDYYLFRKGIQPDWHDTVFERGGGRLVVQIPPRYKQLDSLWLHISLLVIGEGFDDTPESAECVCGAVAACRSKVTKLAVWIASGDIVKVHNIGARFIDFVTEKFLASGEQLKAELKPEFERFSTGTALDALFSTAGEKTVAWQQVQEIVGAATAEQKVAPASAIEEQF